MMSSSNMRPKWWQLYLTFPLLIGLFLVDNRIHLSQRGHTAVQIGILFLVYGLVHLWLKANAIALSKMDRRQYQRTVTVIRVPVPRLSDADKRPMFELPDSASKGMLRDTFETDYIDAESFPVEEVSKKRNRN